MNLVEEINTKNALRIANEWLSKVQYEAPYFGCGDMEAIKKALEKQIPKKITEIHVDEYYCPACGAELNCNDAKVEDKYCRECGQKFEVSEEDGKTNSI